MIGSLLFWHKVTDSRGICFKLKIFILLECLIEIINWTAIIIWKSPDFLRHLTHSWLWVKYPACPDVPLCASDDFVFLVYTHFMESAHLLYRVMLLTHIYTNVVFFMVKRTSLAVTSHQSKIWRAHMSGTGVIQRDVAIIRDTGQGRASGNASPSLRSKQHWKSYVGSHWKSSQ